MTALSRFIPIQFEAVPDGDVGASPDDGGSTPDPVGDTGAAAAASPEPVAPAAEPSQPFDLNSYLQTPEGQQEWNEYQQQYQQAQAPAEEPEDFSDIGELFEAFGIPKERFEKFLESKTAPINQTVEQLRYQNSEQQVNAQVAALPDLSPELFGPDVPEELSTQNRDLLLSVGLGQQALADANSQNYDLGQSFAGIAQKMVARDKIVGEKAVEAYKKDYEESVSGAHPSAAGAGTGAVEGAPRFANEAAVGRYWAERNNIKD